MIWKYFCPLLLSSWCRRRRRFRLAILWRLHLPHYGSRRSDTIKRREARSVVPGQGLNCCRWGVVENNAPFTRGIFSRGKRVLLEEIVHWRRRTRHSRISRALSAAVPPSVNRISIISVWVGRNAAIKLLFFFCFIRIIASRRSDLHKRIHRKRRIVANMGQIYSIDRRRHIITGGLFIIFEASFAHSLANVASSRLVEGRDQSTAWEEMRRSSSPVMVAKFLSNRRGGSAL